MGTLTPFLMPDFSHAHHGSRHDLASALAALDALGVPAGDITVRMESPWRPDSGQETAPTKPPLVTGQEPAAGQPIDPSTPVALTVAGRSLLESLPWPMWDHGPPDEIGTDDILGVLDDPFQKAWNWVREGAPYFDLRRGNPDGCGRWIRLFGIDPETFPPDKWYDLAVLLPHLHRLAGREEGLRRVCRDLLDLEIARIRYWPRYLSLEREERSYLGGPGSRLGIDAVAGCWIEDGRTWILEFGPLRLERYHEMSREHERIEAALRLCIPIGQDYHYSFLVLDAAKSPQLGPDGVRNTVLGVNSYLGGEAW